MSGYNKHPDYGGPPGTWRETAIVVTAILLVVAVVAWISFGL